MTEPTTSFHADGKVGCKPGGKHREPGPFSVLLLLIGLGPMPWSGIALAHPQPIEPAENEAVTALPEVAVEGRATSLVGIAESASQGIAGQPEFKYRPLSRVGELVEVVPGTLATQHSGSGKANQFFLRGFNLDHGTDFTTSLDGIPLNLPSHAHGQGYLDLNSVIPELVDKVEFGKGPYHADLGDFSSAGYAKIHSLHRLEQAFVNFTGGEYDYYRGVAGRSGRVGNGELLYGGEVNFFAGPWQQAENLNKYNGLIRYTVDEADHGLAIDGKAYHSTWRATNQIPERAVDSGMMGLYDTLDASDGGDTHRYSLGVNGWRRGDDYRHSAQVYAVYSDLDLYSNFTGFLDDPVNGDQIQQKERRWIGGGQAEQTWFNQWFGLAVDNTLGVQVRHDSLDGLGLSHTRDRRLLARRTLHDLDETTFGFFFSHQTHWLSWFRTVAGVRSDTFVFDIRDRLDARNSGSRSTSLISPKLSLIFGPWHDSEVFINLGYGFHSNDARGVTKHVDADGNPVDPVSPVAKTRGAEVGFRTQAIQGINSTLAFWWLRSGQELVFVGDAGTTEPTGKSERYGVEWTNYVKPLDWLTLDADLAFTKAWYVDEPERANHIPNAVGRVISAGAVAELPHDFYLSLRLRHFGEVPLVEDRRATLGDTTLVNLGAGYRYRQFKLQADVLNLLDSRQNDIAYYYPSRLQDEPAGGFDGILKHPVMPRMVRLTAGLTF